MRREPQAVLIYLALAALIFAVYGQVFHFDFVSYDDPDYVAENPHIASALSLDNVEWAMTSGYAANWHPLTWLSHMLDVQLFGLKSGWHHLTNVLLHTLSSILLFAALRRMTGAFWRSAFVAALFALHPLRVESVAWIAERKDVLSTCFWMLTLYCYARYVEKPNAIRYSMVVVGFALGLMSKSMLVTLPFTLLLLDVWPLQRIDRQNLWRRIAEKAPLFAMCAAVSAINYVVQQGGGAVNPFGAVPMSLRIENALVSYIVYLWMMIWPANLAVIYHLPAAIPLWAPCAAAVAIIAIAGFVLLKGRSAPYLPVGWLWYLGTLVPVLGLIQVGLQSRADRYTYAPSIGIFIMIVWGIGGWVCDRPRVAKAAVVGGAAWLVALMAATFVQVGYWRNSLTLFSHAVAVTPDNDLSQTNLAKALDASDRIDEALAHYRKAEQLDPTNPDAQAGFGVTLAESGSAEEGLPHSLEAIRLRPNYAMNYFELGEVYGFLGRLDESEAAFRRAVDLEPWNSRSHFNLGIALGKQGKLSEATEELGQATRLKPGDAAAWFNLGSALAQSGRLSQAVAAFQKAVELDPGNSDARTALQEAEDLLRNNGGP